MRTERTALSGNPLSWLIWLRRSSAWVRSGWISTSRRSAGKRHRRLSLAGRRGTEHGGAPRCTTCLETGGYSFNLALNPAVAAPRRHVHGPVATDGRVLISGHFLPGP